MTGKPMPMDAQQRMQMAPEVFQFSRNFAKKPNILEKTGNLIKNIGKTTLMGAAGLAAAPAFVEQQGTTGAKSTDSEPKPIGKTPDGQLLYDAADLNNSGVEQQKTTADSYGQDRVENQTASNTIMRSGTQTVDLENNKTIAKDVVETQALTPDTPVDARIIERADDLAKSTGGFDATPKKSEEQILSEMKQYEEQAGLTRIGGPANVSEKVQEFLKQDKLNPVLLSAMEKRGQEEELVGTSFPIASRLSDNPQIALDGGQSTRAQSRDFIKETEPIGGVPTNVDPSTLTPEVKNVLSNIAKGMATIPLKKQIDAAKKIVDSRSPNEVFGKESKDRDLIAAVKEGIPLKDREAAKSRVDQKTAAKQRKSGIESPLTKTYYPEGVARTDIQVGGMKDRKTGLGRSVGISYTPLNGDTKVGFNIMPDPTKPTEVKTYDFTANQKAVESMKSEDKFSKLFNLATKRKEGFSSYEA
jgi:hypothetical protein